VEQLHLGGGTPTFLNPMQLRELMADLRRHFTLADDDRGDYSIEIDPREADWSTMGLLRELGFNRVSFGVQDLDLQVQLAINRLQPFDDTRTLVEAARALDYRSINLDLIYGLPRQTPASFAHTVERVLELQPHRLSVFNYAHLPQRFPPQRRIEASELPDPAAKLEMLQRTVEQLLAAGYRYIGMDHFALPDDDLAIAQEDGTLQRNFQGYTTHGHCDLLGLGVSAISQVGEVLCQNTPDLARYQARLGQGELAVARGLRRSRDDRIRGAVIAQLICHFQLDFAAIERSCELDFRQYFADAWPHLEAMAADGLIRLDARGVQVLAPGRLLIRALCMLFDRYLADHDKQRFSQVI
jgi:oxygen-independent coproporphyrinogen-3 oxidase